jgi:hypothetical protein
MKLKLLTLSVLAALACAVVAWSLPTSAKADRLPWPAFHLECRQFVQCQDV